MHARVFAQPAAKAHTDVWCRTAFPEDQSGGGDDAVKEEGEEGGNPQEARLQRSPSPNRKVRTEGDRIFGGEPEMGWRYRGEVGPPPHLVGRKEGIQMGVTPLKV